MIFMILLLFCHCRVWLFAIPWIAVLQASLPHTVSGSLLKFMFIESVMPSNHCTLSRPLVFLPSIFPSIRVFSNESALCITWSKYWASASVLPMNVHGWFPLGLAGLIPLQSEGLSRVFSNTTVQKHQFFGTQPFLWKGFKLGILKIWPWSLNFALKNPDAGQDWRQEEKGTTEDEMVGWYRWLNGQEFE